MHALINTVELGYDDTEGSDVYDVISKCHYGQGLKQNTSQHIFKTQYADILHSYSLD